jgi:transposase
MPGGRTVDDYNEVLWVWVLPRIGTRLRLLRVAGTGKLDTWEKSPPTLRQLVRKLARPGLRLRFCYEAEPTGYGLKREIEALGHECAVIAPSLISHRAGDRVKTNRRDAEKLARLFYAGELTEIWTPDAAHEAMRDLVRAREAAVKDRTRKRQEIRSFL